MLGAHAYLAPIDWDWGEAAPFGMNLSPDRAAAAPPCSLPSVTH